MGMAATAVLFGNRHAKKTGRAQLLYGVPRVLFFAIGVGGVRGEFGGNLGGAGLQRLLFWAKGQHGKLLEIFLGTFSPVF